MLAVKMVKQILELISSDKSIILSLLPIVYPSGLPEACVLWPFV